MEGDGEGEGPKGAMSELRFIFPDSDSITAVKLPSSCELF